MLSLFPKDQRIVTFLAMSVSVQLVVSIGQVKFTFKVKMVRI